MSIAAIDFIPPGMNVEQMALGPSQAPAQPFSNWLQTQVSDLNSTMVKNDAMVADLATGQTENLHQIMIGMEEAKIAFQLAVQVRNRILEAYQDVLRMQV